jgi:hypothetical protein
VLESRKEINKLGKKWDLQVFSNETDLTADAASRGRSETINQHDILLRDSKSKVGMRKGTIQTRPPSYTQMGIKVRMSKEKSEKGLAHKQSTKKSTEADKEKLIAMRQAKGVIESVKFTKKHHTQIYERPGSNTVEGEVIKIGAICYQNAASFVKKETVNVKAESNLFGLNTTDENKKKDHF